MTTVLLIILLNASASSSTNTVQIPVEDYKTCEERSGEMRALLHKSNVKAITTCIKVAK